MQAEALVLQPAEDMVLLFLGFTINPNDVNNKSR